MILSSTNSAVLYDIQQQKKLAEDESDLRAYLELRGSKEEDDPRVWQVRLFVIRVSISITVSHYHVSTNFSKKASKPKPT